MSGFFKYVDYCADVAGSPPDDTMEGDGDFGLELEALFISNNSTEITYAPIEIITVPASEDEPEDLGADFPALSAAEISESSGDEGEDDVDDGKEVPAGG